MSTNIRSATPMEKIHAKAVGMSAILVVALLTVAIIFTAVALNDEKPGEDIPIGASPIVMEIPTNGTLLKEYYNGLQKNETSGRWEGHYAVDFAAAEGTPVLATFDGTVSDITFNSVNGKAVTITHRDGVQTVYKGLSEAVDVSVGQAVAKGQVVGSVGNTMTMESADGAHIHVEVIKDGKKVNPADYIPYDGK